MSDLRSDLVALRDDLAARSVVVENDYIEGRIDERGDIIKLLDAVIARHGEDSTYCAYCGADFPLDDKAASQVSGHIATCPKHPMRDVEKRAETAEAQLATLSELLAEAREQIARDHDHCAPMDCDALQLASKIDTALAPAPKGGHHV